MIKAQIDAGCRDREVRGKETECLFEDDSLFCLETDHTAQSVNSHHRPLCRESSQGVRGQRVTKQQQQWIYIVVVKDITKGGLTLVHGLVCRLTHGI